MSSFNDAYLGLTPETEKYIPSSNVVPKQDTGSIFDVLQQGFKVPGVGTSSLDEFKDDAEHAKPIKKEELQKMYPDAPSDLFKTDKTKRFADYVYNKYKEEYALESLKELNQSEAKYVPSWARDIGYGIAQTSPLSVAAGIAASAAITAVAPAVGLGALVAKDAPYIMKAAVWATDGFIGGSFDYLATKATQEKTQEDPNFVNLALGGAAGGLVIGSLLHFGSKVFKRAAPKLKTMLDEAADAYMRGNREETPVTRIPRPFDDDPVWYARTQIGDTTAKKSITGALRGELEHTGKTVDVSELTTLGKLKYKVYAASEYIPNDEESGVVYALVNQESQMTHNGAELPFAGATYASENSGTISAFAASIGQAGRMVKINLNYENILNLDKDTSLLKSVLKEYEAVTDGVLPENASAQEMINFINNQDTSELIQSDITNLLKDSGYRGLTYRTSEKIADRTFSKSHTFLFDGVSGLDAQTVAQLDGSLGALPEATILNNEITSKSYNLRYSEGILSNGKKIMLDEAGYFLNDPYYGGENALGYIEYYSKNSDDFIKKAIEDGKPLSAIKKLKGASTEVIERLKQVKEFEMHYDKEAELTKINDSFKDVESFIRLPEKERLTLYRLVEKDLKTRRVIDDIFKNIANDAMDAAELAGEKVQIEAGFAELFKKDSIAKLVSKSTEQMGKEFKALTIVEKANIERDVKLLSERVFSNNGTPKSIDKIGAIIEIHNAKIEALAKESPELYDEILKASEFCLRRNI